MTKHTHNTVAAAAGVQGDEGLPNRGDAQPAVEPKLSGDDIALASAGRGIAGRKRKRTHDSEAARQKPIARGPTKTEIVLKKLRSAKGVTIAQLGDATGWQAHSVRGFLSAVVKKKLGLNLVSDVGKDGARRYRVGAKADRDHTDGTE